MLRRIFLYAIGFWLLLLVLLAITSSAGAVPAGSALMHIPLVG